MDQKPVRDHEALLKKVLPDYPACGKRTLQDNGGWLKTLRRNNVELVRTPIDHIAADAVVTEDGQRCPADVIVYSTGFHTSRAQWPIQVVGRDGGDLQTLWGERPYALLGITVHGFPNFFCMYGPGANLAHGRQPDLAFGVPDPLHHERIGPVDRWWIPGNGDLATPM